MVNKVPRPRPPAPAPAPQPPEELRKDVAFIRIELGRFSFAAVHERADAVWCGHKPVGRAALRWLIEQGELVEVSRSWGRPQAP